MLKTWRSCYNLNVRLWPKADISNVVNNATIDIEKATSQSI